MISQWNYQCTHQIPGKMGAYFIQFKVVRLNGLTAIENVVNLVNSSLILTPFFAKIYLRNVVRQSSRSVWSFLCMTVNQDTALSSTAHNYIYIFFVSFEMLKWPAYSDLCFFLPFATDYNFVSLAFTLTHEFCCFFLHMALICQEASGKTASRLVPVKNGLLFVQAMSCSVKITRFAFWTAAPSWV